MAARISPRASTTELTAIGSRERPDVIGFRSNCSAVIECKVSRGDFLAERRKPERASGGLGVYRFYLCPEGLIDDCDLPPRWGLLHAVGRTVKAVVAPMGNLWPPVGIPDEQTHLYTDWLKYQHQPNQYAERQILYSIARRLSGNGARGCELATALALLRACFGTSSNDGR